ncbi:MAG: DUF4435 domain-containing protein [bacterium]|nr:DUF4435 domain-containing protein [bacterium]
MEYTGDMLANEIILTRDIWKGSVLITEGTKDIKIFRKFLHSSDIPVFPAWGKQNLFDAVDILNSAKERKILAIIDADFNNCTGKKINTNTNILQTDCHDVEMMIIKSSSFDHFMKEFVSEDKAERMCIRNGKNDVRELLFDLAKVVGVLRLMSVIEDLRLKFEDLEFDRIIDKKNLLFNVETFVRSVLSQSKNPYLKVEIIIKKLLKELKNQKYDPYQICCGHDFIAILSISLRSAIGSKQHAAVETEQLESVLRLAYDFEEFKKTKLYSCAKKWEIENTCDLFKT